jgi:hypothetical protein
MALHHRRKPSLSDKHKALSNEDLKQTIAKVKQSTPKKVGTTKDNESDE